MTDPGLCFKQGISLRRLCSPWRRKWQSTPVFLPGESQQRSLAGYSPWGRKESDMTEWLSMHTHTHTHTHAHGGASLCLGLNRTCFGSAYCVQLCSLTSSLPRHPFMTSWDILKPFWLSFKFFLLFKLKYSWFTMLCWLQVYSKVIQWHFEPFDVYFSFPKHTFMLFKLPSTKITFPIPLIRGIFIVPCYGSTWLSWWLCDKEDACQSRRCRFNPWVRNIWFTWKSLFLWRRK